MMNFLPCNTDYLTMYNRETRYCADEMMTVFHIVERYDRAVVSLNGTPHTLEL